MLDLRRLRLLRDLARLGTITAVAEARSYSASAVSQQLSALEKETGVRLLEAAGRRVRLTAQAEVLVAHAEVLLAEVERAEAALARSRHETVGTLRVAAFQTAVLALVPTALTRLRRRHPGLRVEVTELESEVALPALVAGEFDLVLGEEYPGHPLPRPRETERQDLLTDELRLVVPPGWRERSLPRLASRPFVLEPAGTIAREWATAACRQAGFEPDVRYTSTDLLIHLRFVEHGLAAALLPDLAGATHHAAVTTRRLPGRPERAIFATTRQGASGHPGVEAFTAAIRTPADATSSPEPGTARH
ncbi:LysR substrate-binding domain-containing protein [Actinokineospora diospyrosa]|uniref:DNA-binding transcriptional regulator, LysR family n=1 Tax=Actinokineospora diospyrosa TaxID=103728 RepID=A0ABT1IBF1_9PSEU|nr:LysR substrate-binding domain-containing protein [Actinokineospora diospyrosa]MCP2269954.1 DNA-binding transcriptional regulator, LysR family [Actinokineospora diospyrosa]